MSTQLLFCRTCCMDGSATEIMLDMDGVCNFCYQAQKALRAAEAEKPNLPKIIERIKRDGRGKKYDCLIGLSGGVDSSTVLHHAVRLGLRPFCFTLDNGWNLQEKADQNIQWLVETFRVPLYRYVVDTKKFRELQVAFLKGGVKNLEALTDHILFAATHEMANKHKIKWIISGGNVATESVMPVSWGEDPRDLRWIKGVYRKIAGRRLTGLPLLSLWKEQCYRLIKQIKTVRLLDYLDYNREKSINLLKDRYKYIPYGDKHCESIFTSWYQNFYLFEKYGIDKRKAHFSSLINSGQMTREEAMELLKQPPVYPSLGIEERALKYPKKNYYDYPNSEWVRKIVVKLYRYIPKRWK